MKELAEDATAGRTMFAGCLNWLARLHSGRGVCTARAHFDGVAGRWRSAAGEGQACMARHPRDNQQ